MVQELDVFLEGCPCEENKGLERREHESEPLQRAHLFVYIDR